MVGRVVGCHARESERKLAEPGRVATERVYTVVFIPMFEGVQEEGGSDFALTGLGKGGQQVQKCRETFTRSVETLVELASLQVGSKMALSTQLR